MTRLQFTRYVEPAFVALFLAALLFLAIESYWLENTILGLRLFWLPFLIGFFAGFLPAAVFGYFHHHLISGLSGPLPRTLRLASFSALCFSFLLPSIASYVNRKFVVGPARQIEVTITEKGLGGKSGNTPYIFFPSSPDVTERIEVNMHFYHSISVGERMSLTLERGYFGFDVVRSWGRARDDARPRSFQPLDPAR